MFVVLVRHSLKQIIKVWGSIVFALVPLLITAQDRCATVPYMKGLQQQKMLLEGKPGFERWIQEKIENRKQANRTERRQAATYQIPVVVHVVHNGEAIGVGSNISDAQILSQIDVLNQDYQRLNTDAANTPSEFLPVAGSLDIEFVLAKRTPEGLATNGIVRVLGSQTVWSLNDNYLLKSQSYWPAEDYMNIWVTNLSSSYVGYAQFPVSNLPGLENSSNNRLTDGVVIDHHAFGTIDAGNFDLDNQYNKGRTSTHEIGHFLGLNHTWGDDEDDADKCAGTDNVDDTPNQQISTSGCPSSPRTSCSSSDMYQNYLDYTNDACMNIFTQGQVARMIVVLENSPRRASLLTSPGLLEPAPLANDLGIHTIVTPVATICNTSETPSIEIENFGSNTITAAQVSLSVNGTPVQTLNLALNLTPQETQVITFNPVAVSPGDNIFSFEIISTNNTTDGNTSNNLKDITSNLASFIGVPFTESFNSMPSSWLIVNPDQLITWQTKTAPAINPSNQAAYLNFYDYENHFGELDILTTPVFDLSLEPSAYLSFDVAYAPFQGSADGLRVVALTDCQSVAEGTIVYEKSGNTLATAPATSVPFTPSNDSQWRKEIIDLSAFLGEGSIQLAFVGINDWGNNLYVDNIAVITTAEEDLVLKEIISPTPVRCDSQVIPELNIQNAGTVAINSFLIDMSIDGAAPVITPLTLTLQPGESTILTLPEITLAEGQHTISFILSEPNGLVDITPADNSQSTNTIISNAEAEIPLRENFDGNFENQWTIINPTDGEPWQPIQTNYSTSLYFNSFDNVIVGDEAWLVSPVLDFSFTNTASVFFDVSYAYNAPNNDQLKVLLSTDCGKTYDVVRFDEGGQDLAVTSSSSPWSPDTASDWIRKFVTLNILSGAEEARLAFVVSNDNGNNLYLDNIEFFTSDNPNPPSIESNFLIYGTSLESPGNFYLTFNLTEPQQVGYEIINAVGQQIVSTDLGNVLNQTYLIDAGNVATGIYIVRLNIGGEYYATKVFLSN